MVHPLASNCNDNFPLNRNRLVLSNFSLVLDGIITGKCDTIPGDLCKTPIFLYIFKNIVPVVKALYITLQQIVGLNPALALTIGH